MTQEQKRIKIAEACGWKRHYNTDMQWRYDGDGPDDWVVEDDLPDYFNDLNAMHEAEKVLDDAQWSSYVMAFVPIFKQDASTHGWSIARSLIRATATQRAEAFGRTLELWT